VRGGEASWLPDGSGFFYNRLAQGFEQRARADRFKDHRTYLRLLAEPDADRVVFGPGVDPRVAIDRSSVGVLFALPDERLVAAYVYHGVDPNHSLYLAALDDVLAGRPAWRKVFDASALVNEVAVARGALYVKTAKDAPRYQVLRMKLPEADLAHAEVAVPPGEGVVVTLAGAREGAYVTRREGVVKRLYRLDDAAPARLEPIRLPVEGNVAIVDANVRISGIVAGLAGWTRASAEYVVAPDAHEARALGLARPGRFDAPANIVAREVRVASHDGVEVPVSILSRADIRLDGSNPTILYGYGAYGIVQEPGWTPRTLAWLEQGGVYAIAHVRGGGIYGDAWRRAGWKATKPNTWKDGIAAGEWLVKHGYTSPSRLFVYGGSAGGIFVGRAITERPDLFAAAVIAVGNTDSIRSETRANGAGNIPEYGTVTKEDEFHALREMSPYEHVKPGTRYPAVLFTHGINDTRVDVWMTLKMGARLAAATTSGKPVLMRLEAEAGHGPGATLAQAQGRMADMWSFLLWQAGAPAYQPKASP
jgi:prolyl oligopeptidase